MYAPELYFDNSRRSHISKSLYEVHSSVEAWNLNDSRDFERRPRVSGSQSRSMPDKKMALGMV